MKENEQLVNFVMDRRQWQVVKLIARTLKVHKGEQLQVCSASDVIRELLEDWLAEMSKEHYPKLLTEAKAHDVQNGLTEFLEQQLKEMESD